MASTTPERFSAGVSTRIASRTSARPLSMADRSTVVPLVRRLSSRRAASSRTSFSSAAMARRGDASVSLSAISVRSLRKPVDRRARAARAEPRSAPRPDATDREYRQNPRRAGAPAALPCDGAKPSRSSSRWRCVISSTTSSTLVDHPLCPARWRSRPRADNARSTEFDLQSQRLRRAAAFLNELFDAIDPAWRWRRPAAAPSRRAGCPRAKLLPRAQAARPGRSGPEAGR